MSDLFDDHAPPSRSPEPEARDRPLADRLREE